MKEKWILETKKADFNAIGKKYNINPVLARIMVNRGITQEDQIRSIYMEVMKICITQEK